MSLTIRRESQTDIYIYIYIYVIFPLLPFSRGERSSRPFSTVNKREGNAVISGQDYIGFYYPLDEPMIGSDQPDE